MPVIAMSSQDQVGGSGVNGMRWWRKVVFAMVICVGFFAGVLYKWEGERNPVDSSRRFIMHSFNKYLTHPMRYLISLPLHFKWHNQ